LQDTSLNENLNNNVNSLNKNLNNSINDLNEKLNNNDNEIKNLLIQLTDNLNVLKEKNLENTVNEEKQLNGIIKTLTYLKEKQELNEKADNTVNQRLNYLTELMNSANSNRELDRLNVIKAAFFGTLIRLM